MTLTRSTLAIAASALIAAAPAGRVVGSLDLAASFATRTPWRLTVRQGPPVADPIMDSSERVPGVLTLCLSRDGGRTCEPQLGSVLRVTGADDLYAEPHELRRLAVVHPRPSLPLVLLQIASLHSVNGDQRVGTELYAYDRTNDRFRRVFARQVGRNNNQEVRYIERGPLAGAVVAAEPTQNAPFGFWISVYRASAAGDYRQTLRYRSATRYGDGNSLAVIDSDMPALLSQLGLWRRGSPLPKPANCASPRLVGLELWCAAPAAAR